MTITHQLKSWPEFFRPVYETIKNFELRKNDRNFQIGDIIVLNEYEPSDGGHFTGRSLRRRVTYVLHRFSASVQEVELKQPLWGLEAGYCILALEEIE
jgi:Domain of unknown function (DUF3850)